MTLCSRINHWQARTFRRRRRIEKGLLTRDRAEKHLLQNAKQYALLAETPDARAVSELPMLLRDLLRHRLRARRPHLLDQEVQIAVQTRPVPSSEEASRDARRRADLTIRMQQNPRNQLPAELDYRCLRETLPILIDSIHNKGVDKVTFFGGCHPSVAWALGAALPDARGLKEFSWVDAYQEGAVWRSRCSTQPVRSSVCLQVGCSAPVPINPEQPPSAEDFKTLLGDADPSRGIVVHLATGRHAQAPVTDLAERLGGAPTVVLDVVGSGNAAGRTWVPPEEGEKLARLLGTLLRNLAGAGKGRLHLSFSGAVPLVALTARHCNTIEVQVYEFAHHTDGRPDGYVPVFTAASGRNPPVVRVFGQGVGEGAISRLVNLTPHDVTLYQGDQPVHTWQGPGENRAWVRQEEHPVSLPPLLLDDVEVPHTRLEAGGLTGLPHGEEGTGYIVSRISAAAARRSDFFFPHGEVRDEHNVLVGCRGLGSFVSPSDEVKPFVQWLPDRGEE